MLTRSCFIYCAKHQDVTKGSLMGSSGNLLSTCKQNVEDMTQIVASRLSAISAELRSESEVL